MNEAILIVVYNRPQYLKEVLDSISKAYNIENFDIFFNIDYDAKSFYRNMLLIRKFLRKTNKQFFKNNIQINKPALGCGANHKHGLTRVFSQGYKNIVCIEDDIIVAPDIFVLFNQVRKEYNPFILNLFGCTEYDEKNKLNKLFWTNNFTPWGWGISFESYKEIIDKILWDHTWDMQINEYTILNRKNNVDPHYSRGQNIGANGLHDIEGTVNYWVKNPTSLVLKNHYPNNLTYIVE